METLETNPCIREETLETHTLEVSPLSPCDGCLPMSPTKLEDRKECQPPGAPQPIDWIAGVVGSGITPTGG